VEATSPEDPGYLPDRREPIALRFLLCASPGQASMPARSTHASYPWKSLWNTGTLLPAIALAPTHLVERTSPVP
jgi:hypothetical protein